MPATLRADDVYSNTRGGGNWSEPATWKGGKVPGADDDVVLARDDVVTFDRNDDGKITCHQISLDPRSVLQFKTGDGPIVLCVDGLVETYGHLKLDGTKSPRDKHELRFISPDPEQRKLKIAQGGGLSAAGRAALPKNARNVIFSSISRVSDETVDPTAILETEPGTSLDVQRVEFKNIYVQATGIDNTGAKPGERINVVRNKFNGTSRLLLTSCDTPLVADNLFERDALPALQQAAIYFNSCPLTECRGNTVRGTYAGGITCYGQTEMSVTNNTLEKLPSGLYYYGSNAMIRGLTLRDCVQGLVMTSASGALEDVTIERSQHAYYHGGATVQFTNLVIKDMIPHPQGYVIYYGSGPLTLLNSDIKAEQVTFVTAKPDPPVDNKPRPPAVQSLHYFIAEVNGNVPSGADVLLRTANPPAPLPAGAVDPNLRNVPAALSPKGLTPYPRSLEPIIVRGWQYDPDYKLIPAPEYVLEVRVPSLSAGAPPRIAHSQKLTPTADWYRPEPNAKKPTVEITLP